MQEGIFTYEGDRPRRWLGEPTSCSTATGSGTGPISGCKVESIDPEKRVISLAAKPDHDYGYRKGQWYYAYNLLLGTRPARRMVSRPRQGHPLLLAARAAGAGQADRLGVAVAGGDERRVARHAFRPDAGGLPGHGPGAPRTRPTCGSSAARSATRAAGPSTLSGRDSSVVGCDIYETGDGGITLGGGDRKTLTPAGLVADNNHIHHYGRWNRMYRPAVALGGVGNRATHNLIDNAPHQAIGFGGNDHLIEFNEIHSVCYESNDAGAIYAGRNWTMRGTVIRHNYLHDISGFEGRGCVGVYLDDQFCGTEICGNLFYKVTRAAMIGGGRDCTIANNIFVDCTPAMHVDARGLGWAAAGCDGLKKGLEAVPYQEPLWAGRYPKLVHILDDEPMAPKGNRDRPKHLRRRPLGRFRRQGQADGRRSRTICWIRIRGSWTPSTETSSSRTTRRPSSWASSGFRWRRSGCTRARSGRRGR